MNELGKPHTNRRGAVSWLRLAAIAFPAALLLAGPALASPWTTEDVAEVGDVGVVIPEAAFAIGADGSLHVVFVTDTGGLEYGVEAGGGWTFETLDAEGAAHVSLAVGLDGSVHVVFFDGAYGGVRYAGRVSGAWSYVDIETAGEGSTSIVVGAGGCAHVAYYASLDAEVHYASSDTWDVELVAAVAVSGDAHVSLAIEACGVAHAVFNSSGEVVYSQRLAPGMWDATLPIAAAAEMTTGIAIDDANVLHVVYQDDLTAKLTHSWSAVGDLWASATIDSSGASVDLEASLDFDAEGNLYVGYHRDGRLWLARWWANELNVIGYDGMWSIEAGVEADLVMCASLAVDSNGDVCAAYMADVGGTCWLKCATRLRVRVQTIVNGLYEDGSYPNDDDEIPTAWTKHETRAWESSVISLNDDNGDGSDFSLHWSRSGGGASGDWTTVEQEMYVKVGATEQLDLDLNVTAIGHDLGGSGWTDTKWEYPVTVLIVYADSSGTTRTWQYGWYITRNEGYPPPDEGMAVREGRGYVRSEQVPMGVETPAHFDLLAELDHLPPPGPDVIQRIRIGGSGWSFEGMADDLQMTGVVGVDATTPVGGVLQLMRPRPNPFATSTVVALVIPDPTRGRVDVFSADGRRVATLLEGTLAAGRRVVSWGGRDELGRPSAPGVYFVRLETSRGAWSRKVCLLE